MNYNLLKYDISLKDFVYTEKKVVPNSINESLKLFESELIKEYLKAQKGRKGIKTLGNQIRYNSIISKKVFFSSNDFVLIKSTGNRKDFMKDFIVQINNNSKDLFFFIYDKHFVTKSKIVDPTTTKRDDIKNDLDILLNIFREHKFKFNLYLIEFKNVEGYHFQTDDEGFTKIIENYAV